MTMHSRTHGMARILVPAIRARHTPAHEIEQALHAAKSLAANLRKASKSPTTPKNLSDSLAAELVTAQQTVSRLDFLLRVLDNNTGE